MYRVLLSIVMTLVIAACGAQATQPGAGIQGIVEVGPTCPVERINSPCPPHPLAATVVVRDASGAEVTRFHSGSDGHFRVDLQPGTYAIVGLTTGSSFLPRPIATTATVVAGTYTTVNVQYDSGIR